MSVKRVTGHGAFAGDLRVPGLLHVRVVRSPHAHARVLRIDPSAARALPGVVAVLGQADLPGGAAAPASRSVFDATVRFVGDRVAVVAAEDPELALRAAEAVRVEYEERTPVLDPEAALLLDAVAVHETANAPRNLAARVLATLGDVERAFAEAERVLEETYRVPAAQAAPIEPHLVITWLDEDGRLVVRTSTESPFRVRRTLAERLDIPAASILVVQPQVGGGFGAKSDVVAEDLCALVTLRTGRPARLAFSREEELTVAPARAAQTVRLRVGLRARRLTAMDLRVLVDAGAYPEGSESLLRAAAREALSLYGVPDVRFVGEAAFTHRPPTGPLRGQGVLATLFALESHLDLVADALEEDPLELRRRHLATHEHTLRVAESLHVPAPAGHFDASEAMAVGAREIGWSGRATTAAGSSRRGVGMALVRQAVVGERGAASLQLREDGSFNLFVGASAMGNGAEEAFAAAVAEALGVPVERVVPAAGDTDSAPLDPGAAAPTLYLTGRAVQEAAARVRSQILEAGARHLGADAQDLVAEDEQVRTRDGRSVSFAVLAAQAFGSAEPIAATALHAAEESAPAGAAVFAEVEADVETGEVRVLKLVAAIEGGPRLDPRLAEAEVEGDALRSAGDALFEHMAFTEDGRAVFRSFRDYRIATAADAPEVRALFVPLDAPPTRFGARPLGDVAATGPALAVANAVAHAVGARFNDLPLGPERVRKAGAPRAP